MWTLRQSSPFVGLALLAAMTTGCAVTRPEQADRGEQVPIEEFLHEHLHAQPMVTVAEAYRAMVLLADGDDTYDSFAAREQALTERGIARPAWKLTREACIDRGAVAYMVCKILRIRSGVNFTLLGSLGVGDRRYAVRELAYLDLLDSMPPYRYMSGAELVDLLGKADAYMAKEGLYEEEPVDFVETLDAADTGP